MLQSSQKTHAMEPNSSDDDDDDDAYTTYYTACSVNKYGMILLILIGVKKISDTNNKTLIKV